MHNNLREELEEKIILQQLEGGEMKLGSPNGELLKSVGTYTRREQWTPLLQTPLIGLFPECDPCKSVLLSLLHWLAPVD